jgi:hypothetical protein
MQQVQENAQLGCGLQGGNWGPTKDAHLTWCLQTIASDPGKIDAERKFRQNEIDKCKLAKAGGGGGGGGAGGAATIVKAATMYNDYREGNKDLCYMVPGDTATVLPLDGAGAPWMHLKGTSGGCNGQTGYVYNEGEVQVK